MPTTTTDTAQQNGTAPPADDPMLDEEWLSAPSRRPRARLALLALLAAAVCFLGGAFAQKQLGADTTTTASGFPAGGAAPQGFPGGGGAPQGFPGGAGQEGAGAGPLPAAGTGTGSGTADDTQDVIGTVVSVGDGVVVVEDFGGKRHRIKVTDARVTKETTIRADQLAMGDRVQVSGQTTSGNDLQAESVTVR